ncbi:ABC transporter ATP-binding protein [Cohnella faecalis]|nr:ATP-binding cassette domain-containing protein [Cohnella faecalis]
MARMECRNLTFTYAQADRPALQGISLTVARGEFVVLSGPSGSGKSTLLRLLKREVSPGGTLHGSILLEGRPLQDWDDREAAAAVGLVMQHPDNQLVVDRVEHELAFGMENFGLSRGEMKRRMAEMAGFFGLEPLLARRTDELSGGQKQTVNLAAVLMMQPSVLLLDEPLAQLDPLAARDLLGMIKRLNEEWGITVILSEHRIDDLLPLADRIVRLEHGEIAFQGPPREFASEAWARGGDEWAASLPAVTSWALNRGENREGLPPLLPPLTVKEARAWLSSDSLSERGITAGGAQEEEAKRTSRDEPILLGASGLYFSYDPRTPAVIRGLEWDVRLGDWISLFGGNGSGKSTLLQLMAGLRKPQRGEVKLSGERLKKIPETARYARIGYLAQNPLLHYAHETLEEDLRHAALRAGLPEPTEEARGLARRFGIEQLMDRHPHDLSGGERQLGALAMTLASRPELLLLDEPTKGLDPMAKRRLAGHLAEAHRLGTAIVMATHDVEFAAAYATRCSLLFRGEIVADDRPEAFFRGNLFYATALHRLFASTRPVANSVGEEPIFL